jgi:hypothetical protein
MASGNAAATERMIMGRVKRSIVFLAGTGKRRG